MLQSYDEMFCGRNATVSALLYIKQNSTTLLGDVMRCFNFSSMMYYREKKDQIHTHEIKEKVESYTCFNMPN